MNRRRKRRAGASHVEIGGPPWCFTRPAGAPLRCGAWRGCQSKICGALRFSAGETSQTPPDRRAASRKAARGGAAFALSSRDAPGLTPRSSRLSSYAGETPRSRGRRNQAPSSPKSRAQNARRYHRTANAESHGITRSRYLDVIGARAENVSQRRSPSPTREHAARSNVSGSEDTRSPGAVPFLKSSKSPWGVHGLPINRNCRRHRGVRERRQFERGLDRKRPSSRYGRIKITRTRRVEITQVLGWRVTVAANVGAERNTAPNAIAAALAKALAVNLLMRLPRGSPSDRTVS